MIGHNRCVAVAGERLRWVGAAIVVAAWGAFLVSRQTDAITLAVPAAMVGTLVLTRRPPRAAIWAAGGVATLSIALFGAEHVVPNALLVLALPAGVAAGIACRRRPEIAILALFAVASAFGVIDAFTPIPPSKLADLLLAGLWLGVAWRWLAGGERFALRLPAGVVLLLAFAVVTLAQVAAAPSLSFGLHTFISTGLYLLTVLLVGASELDARAPGDRRQGHRRDRARRRAYAVLRHVIGPAAKERAIASQQPFNFKDGKLLLFGSFESRHQLGLWCALVVPFCAGMAAVLRGRWRFAALAVIPLCAVALIASQSRAALVAAIVGLASCSPCTRWAAPSRGRGSAWSSRPSWCSSAAAPRRSRFPAAAATRPRRRSPWCCTPTTTRPTARASAKWDEALRAIRKQPMGHGLGTANQLQEQQGRFVSIGSFSIDNSYLRVGYEQGIVPALLYIAGLLALALALIRRAAITPDPARAGPALAAAGAMVAYVVVLYPSNAFDGYAALAAWLLAGVGIAPFLAGAPARSAQRRSGSLGVARRSGGPIVAGPRIHQVARVLGEEPLRRADVVARRPGRQRLAAGGAEGVHRAHRRVEPHGPPGVAQAVAVVDVVEVQEVALVEATQALPRVAADQPERAHRPFDVAAAAHPAALVADPAAEHEVQRRRRAARRVLQASVEQLQRRRDQPDLLVHEVVGQPRHGVGREEADVGVEHREELAARMARAGVDRAAVARRAASHDVATGVARELAGAVVAGVVDHDHAVERVHQRARPPESPPGARDRWW